MLQKHNDPLENETHKKINNLLALLQILMEIEDKESEEFQSLLDFLPTGYRNNWHKLVQWGMIFLIMIHHGRRAREGIDQLKKSYFEPYYNSDTGEWVIVKISGERDKNHQEFSENLRKGAVIAFKTYANGKIFFSNTGGPRLVRFQLAQSPV